MRNYKILILSFFTILFFTGYALAEVKYLDQYWNQPDFNNLCEGEKIYKLDAILKHNQKELKKTVQRCLEVIRKDEFEQRDLNFRKEWEKAFLKSQDAWEKLIELDEQVGKYECFCYCTSGKMKFERILKINKTIGRIDELEHRFCLHIWFKNSTENIKKK
jgi:adenine-specific DNA methylase